MSIYAGVVISPFVFAILTLAVARMCVLMTTDTITEPWRHAVRDKLGGDHMLTRGVFCNWCWSVWFAFPMTFFTHTTLDVTVPFWGTIITALAASFIASYLADKVS